MQVALQKEEPVATTSTMQAMPSVLRAWFKGLGWWMGLVLLFATMIEGVVFNHFYFRFAWGDYQTVTVPLPYNEQLRANAYILSPQERSLVLQGLDLELMTVGFKLKGEHTLLNGTLSLTDDSSIVSPILVNKFKVAPADIYTSGQSIEQVQAAPYKLLVRSYGKARALVITFDDLKGQVVLTDLTLNVAPEWSFSLLRWLGMMLLGSALMLVWRKRWYRLRIGDLSARSFRLVQGLSLALSLGVSFGYCYLMLPSHISPNLMFDYIEHGFIHLGNPEQSLLLDFPQSPQELEYHDAYVQNLDALLKGQLHMDVIIDIDLLNAAHDERVYDYGWRTQNGIEGFWDRSFYDSKIYAYYGYGPVIVFYLPLYLLTGCVPSPTLAVLFFGTVAMLGLFLGTYAVARFYGVLPRANALIWCLAQAAALLGTHVVIVQCDLWFYGYAAFLCMGLIGLLTYCAYTIPSMSVPWKKRCALGAIGLIIVLIVQTRPHMILPAFAVLGPILWALARARNWTTGPEGAHSHAVRAYSLRAKMQDALCLAVPLVIGAAITMALNYARFDSVFEFGQRYCLTAANLLFEQVEVNLELISATFEQFVSRSWVDLVDFPYYGVMTEQPHHIGKLIVSQSSVGLLASPVWWGIALGVLLFYSQAQGQNSTISEDAMSRYRAPNRYGFRQAALLKVSLVLVLSLMLVMSYMQYVAVAATVRYLMENLSTVLPFVVLLWVKFIDYDAAGALQTKVCYWLVVGGLVITLVMEGLAPFSELEQYRPYLIPDEWISAQALFSPLSTVR